jgi:branched-chain amino acid transport system permease protein
VIGGVFLAIVLFSPDGLLGLWQRLRARLASRQVTPPRHRPLSSTTHRSET